MSEYGAHKTHCFMIVEPEGEFMGCKYGDDNDCPMKKPYPDEPRMYSLSLYSYNMTTSINVELTPSEADLMRDIHDSIAKQNGSINLNISEI